MRCVLTFLIIGVFSSQLILGQRAPVSAQPADAVNKAFFLIEAIYTNSSWAAMVERPQNRRELLDAVIRKLGGTVENFWFSFGDRDAYVIVSLPGNVSAEALQIAGLAGAGFRSLKTIPLLTVSQAMEASAKAAALRNSAAYKAAHKGLER